MQREPLSRTEAGNALLDFGFPAMKVVTAVVVIANRFQRHLIRAAIAVCIVGRIGIQDGIDEFGIPAVSAECRFR